MFISEEEELGAGGHRGGDSRHQASLCPFPWLLFLLLAGGGRTGATGEEEAGGGGQTARFHPAEAARPGGETACH